VGQGLILSPPAVVLMDAQSRVAAFVETNDLEAPAAYRVLDAVSELGEVAKEVCASADYGGAPGSVGVSVDELGDTLFAVLALCEELDVDAEAALETSLKKYADRLEETGEAGSGEWRSDSPATTHV
jgi:NTP pyrophosphatase (non-canonical NTP hydrolase)